MASAEIAHGQVAFFNPAAAHGRQPKDEAADGAHARPLRRGAALDTFRPLDREQELS